MVQAAGVEAEVEFKLSRGKVDHLLMAQDVGQALAFYKSLKALGMPVEPTPNCVKVDSGGPCGPSPQRPSREGHTADKTEQG